MNRDEVETKIQDNTRLVHYILHKYYPTLEFDEDVIQSAMIGLWISVERFDESKGYSFSTFATTVIHNEIRKYLRVYNKQNRIPTASLDTTINLSSSRDNRDVQVGDLLADPENLEETVVNSQHLYDSLIHFVNNERDKNIITLYAKGFKQEDIANIVGLSQSQVSRLLSKLYEKLTQGD